MINIRQANSYCKDDISKIENYDKAIADTTQTWHLHHRLELTLDGEFAHSRDELKRLGMYYNRPYFELIFMTNSEHVRLHYSTMTVDTRRKMAESRKGKKFTEEHRRHISEAKKGEKHRPFTEEILRKFSEAKKGKHWKLFDGKRVWY